MRNLKNLSNRNNFKHVIVYVHKEFGSLKNFCEGCRSKMLIFSFWARSRAIAPNRARMARDRVRSMLQKLKKIN